MTAPRTPRDDARPRAHPRALTVYRVARALPELGAEPGDCVVVSTDPATGARCATLTSNLPGGPAEALRLAMTGALVVSDDTPARSAPPASRLHRGGASR
jgi:hypothetical protein